MANKRNSTSPFCVNCDNYGWDQPSDKSKIKRCSNCKVMSYCSPECQKEHWKKVHKDHCKYLSGKRVQSSTVHNFSICRYCLKESQVGDEMSTPSVSYLGCPWILGNVMGSRVKIDENIAPSPFQLGEITSQFECQVDHTLFTLQRLFYKVLSIHKFVEDHTISTLTQMRELLRSRYCFIPAKSCYRYFEVIS